MQRLAYLMVENGLIFLNTVSLILSCLQVQILMDLVLILEKGTVEVPADGGAW